MQPAQTNGVERVMRFVNVNMHCIVSNLKSISKFSTLPPLEKFLRMPMIRTIEFCGRQEIPLRGHRDAGAFSLKETDCNDGGFKAALRRRVEAADKQTSDLFLKAPRNASYLSWRVQNQIISLRDYAIRKQILFDTSG